MLLGFSENRGLHRPLVVSAEPIPLVIDSDGIVRIGSTKGHLDTLVAAFHDGATAGEIV
jgi:hypothetical protein